MCRRLAALLLFCACASALFAQDDLEHKIQFHGFVTQGFLYSTANNFLTTRSSEGSLQWTDGAVSVSAAITDTLRGGLQLHMYQLGGFGGGQVQIDWASLDYHAKDYIGLRAGKVKTPLGLFNDTQDVDVVYLWTLLPQSAYAIENKIFSLAHLGGEVYGTVPLGKSAGSLSYKIYGGPTYVQQNSGYGLLLKQIGVTWASDIVMPTYGADLRWQTSLRGLMVGISDMDQTADGPLVGGTLHLAKNDTTVFYSQFERGKFYAAAEYRRNPFVVDMTIGQVALTMPSDPRAWYVMTSYRLRPKLTMGGYYSSYTDHAMDKADPASYAKDWVVSGRYDINTYFYLKLENHFIHGTGISYYTDTNPNGVKPRADLLAAKIGFNF
jgi:hypothetical protein